MSANKKRKKSNNRSNEKQYQANGQYDRRHVVTLITNELALYSKKLNIEEPFKKLLEIKKQKKSRLHESYLYYFIQYGNLDIKAVAYPVLIQHINTFLAMCSNKTLPEPTHDEKWIEIRNLLEKLGNPTNEQELCGFLLRGDSTNEQGSTNSYNGVNIKEPEYVPYYPTNEQGSNRNNGGNINELEYVQEEIQEHEEEKEEEEEEEEEGEVKVTETEILNVIEGLLEGSLNLVKEKIDNNEQMKTICKSTSKNLIRKFEDLNLFDG